METKNEKTNKNLKRQQSGDKFEAKFIFVKTTYCNVFLGFYFLLVKMLN